MKKAGLDESQAGIKIAGRNINSLRYADDITLAAEIEEEQKSLLMWGETWIKIQHSKSKIMASGPITSWQIEMKAVTDFLLLDSKITSDGDFSHEIKRCLLLGKKVMKKLDSILKSKEITFLTKVCIVKAMVFAIVMYRCENSTIKKAECQKIDSFEL